MKTKVAGVGVRLVLFRTTVLSSPLEGSPDGRAGILSQNATTAGTAGVLVVFPGHLPSARTRAIGNVSICSHLPSHVHVEALFYRAPTTAGLKCFSSLPPMASLPGASPLSRRSTASLGLQGIPSGGASLPHVGRVAVASGPALSRLVPEGCWLSKRNGTGRVVVACRRLEVEEAEKVVEERKQRPLKVGIICGGPSAERGISLNSARSVLDHIQVNSRLTVPFR